MPQFGKYLNIFLDPNGDMFLFFEESLTGVYLK
jgi:hypothetical protein